VSGSTPENAQLACETHIAVAGETNHEDGNQK
jgi:hypothetical protein